MSYALYIAIGIVAGISGGFFGIGGGIIIVPALVFLAHMTQKQAQGTSLVALLLPVGLLGVMNYYRANQLDLTAGLIIAIGFVVGVFFGSKIALGLDEALLRRMFAVFLVLVAAQLFFKKSTPPAATPPVESPAASAR